MDKPRVLVLYYSQTGQMRRIIDSILSEVRDDLQVIYAAIQPSERWKFPWKQDTFFDAMPECVLQQPAPIEPVPNAIIHRDYDLIILGWQPWFLHPSQPVTAFLQSNGLTVLKDRPVVTVTGCRNMWINGGEVVKHYLNRVGARHAGNIVLSDRHQNLISLFTIIRWVFKGKKEAGKWLPAAGVQENDIQAAAVFGKPIMDAAKAYAAARYDAPEVAEHGGQAYAGIHAFSLVRMEQAEADLLKVDEAPAELPQEVANLQNRLVELGAVKLNSGLVLLEKRGIKNFRFWAKYIRTKGGPGAPARHRRVMLFRRLLITAIFVLSPLSSLTAAIQRLLQWRKLKRDVAYFKSVAYEPGRI